MSLLGKTYLSPGEVAAQHAENVCKDDRRGYSQYNRKGDGSQVIYQLSDGTKYTDTGGDVDCSELSLDCYRIQDIGVGGASYTGNLVLLLETGNFKCVPIAQRQRGDILNSTKAGHAAIYLGNGMLAEAHHGDGYKGITGVKGDQDGTEVRITSYYDDQWTACYRCTVERKPEPKSGWEQVDGKWYYWENGSMQRSRWIGRKGGDWYYLGSDGAAYQSKWLKDGGEWYWFQASGKMGRDMAVKYGKGWSWIGHDGKAVKYGNLGVYDYVISSQDE